MNFDYLVDRLENRFEELKKDKLSYKYSFDQKIGYKKTVAMLDQSVLIIALSFPKDSMEQVKLMELYDEMDSYYKSLNATEEWEEELITH